MRRLTLAGTALLLALGLGGCVTIDSTQTLQPQSMGPVQLTIHACANGAPSCSGTANTGYTLYGILDGFNSDNTYPVQLLVAARLPADSEVPVNVTANIDGGGTLAFARNTIFEDELQALEPAPAGERWRGWISSQVNYGRKTKQGFTFTVAATLPRPPDSGPLPTPMKWSATVGGRFVDVAAGLPANRQVDCGSTNADLYAGNKEGKSNVETICVDSPSPAATRGYLNAPIVDFGLTGTTVQTTSGGTVTATFLAKRSGVPDPGTTMSLSATGGVPGGTLMLDRSTVSLGGDSAVPVLATVVVPPGAQPGSYPITLVATAPGKPTRMTTSTVVVTAPVGGGGGVGGGTDTQAPTLRSASLLRSKFRVGSTPTPLTATAKKKRTPAGTELRLATDEMGKLDVVVERLDAGRLKGATCSPKAKTGKRCTLVVEAGTLQRSAAAGANTFAFSGRLGPDKLKVGSYRMTLSVVDSAGNRSAKKTLKFKIVAR